jgi:hypothetical protein
VVHCVGHHVDTVIWATPPAADGGSGAGERRRAPRRNTGNAPDQPRKVGRGIPRVRQVSGRRCRRR